MFSRPTPVVLATLIFGFSLSGLALACSTDGWDSESGAVAVGQPSGATPPDLNGVPRVEELCALQADGTGYVQSNAPSHDRVRGRLYIFPEFGGVRTPSGMEPTLLRTYNNEAGTGSLFEVRYNGSWQFDATGNGGTSNFTAASGGWDLIEFDWNPGSNTVDIWVNADATTDAPTLSIQSGGAATMESIRVGLPDGLQGLSGAAFFDSVELHNETAIGPLLIGDANADQTVDIFDYGAVQTEILGTLQTGQPDCNLDGAVDIFDYGCIQQVILGR
ncbi:MAG: hypothetical protein R3212_00815 [Xanthomonadales bacterium]|nr:hypothetical protein [Xanthomonadales bacterium]